VKLIHKKIGSTLGHIGMGKNFEWNSNSSAIKRKY
jgi:hypothetical protein